MVSCKSKETSSPENGGAISAVEESKMALRAIDSDEALIAKALMAAPKESRMGCKIIGYNMAGEFVTLKKSDTNQLFEGFKNREAVVTNFNATAF